jgi:hypothetical protein
LETAFSIKADENVLGERKAMDEGIVATREVDMPHNIRKKSVTWVLGGALYRTIEPRVRNTRIKISLGQIRSNNEIIVKGMVFIKTSTFFEFLSRVMVPGFVTGEGVIINPRSSWWERPWTEMMISFNSTRLTGFVIFEIKRPCWVLSIVNPVFPNKKAEFIKRRTARIGVARMRINNKFRIITLLS